MRKILSEKYCTGCGACCKSCSNNAITMQENNEGFLLPVINQELCVDCKQCVMYCPVIVALKKRTNDVKENSNKIHLYAVRNYDEEILMNSASGGFFTSLATVCLQSSGVVYGVAFDVNFIPHYKRTEELIGIRSMMSSKYVEAVLPDDILQRFFADVKNKRHILFTGTPCLVAGMISMCNKYRLSTDTVYFADFFTCAGVPSRNLWKQSLSEQYNVNAIKNINFRCKEKSYRNYSIKFTWKKNSKPRSELSKLNDWGRLFLFIPHCTRRSCKFCVFLTKKRKADFSLGDMWDASYIPKKWQDDKGVSIVMVNTDKGENLLGKLTAFAEFIALPEAAGNWAGLDIKRNYKENILERQEFWNYFYNNGYIKTIQKFCPVTKKEFILHAIIKPILIKTGLIKYIDRILYKK